MSNPSLETEPLLLGEVRPDMAGSLRSMRYEHGSTSGAGLNAAFIRIPGLYSVWRLFLAVWQTFIVYSSSRASTSPESELET